MEVQVAEMWSFAELRGPSEITLSCTDEETEGHEVEMTHPQTYI